MPVEVHKDDNKYQQKLWQTAICLVTLALLLANTIFSLLLVIAAALYNQFFQLFTILL
jgi:hypothetical protein